MKNIIIIGGVVVAAVVGYFVWSSNQDPAEMAEMPKVEATTEAVTEAAEDAVEETTTAVENVVETGLVRW